jgi:hypothetical protein
MFPGLTNIKQPNAPQPNSTGLGSDNQLQNGVATQNLGGNSLTNQLRSVQNLQSTTGAGMIPQGQAIYGAGVQGFGTAGDTTGTALGTTQGALGSLSPAEDYWTKLLSGDQQTMNKAIAPYATQAGTNYANASTNVAQNAPRGGYAGVLSAGLPQTLSRDVNNQLFSLQPQAAQQLNTIAGTKNAIAGTQGNIAGVQGQLANWLSSLGIDVTKLGGQFLQDASNSLLGGRGQDVAEHGQSMQLAGQAANDLTQLVTAKKTP